MPETTREWVVFVVALIAIGVLCALIVAGPRPSDSAARRSPTPEPPATSTAASRPTTAASIRPTTTTTTTTTNAGPSSATELRLTARADTWVSVRQATSSGPVLFEGTMLAHATKTFTGTSFAVRFGAAANVIARLNGHALSLPGGTYSATITRSGLGPRSA